MPRTISRYIPAILLVASALLAPVHAEPLVEPPAVLQLEETGREKAFPDIRYWNDPALPGMVNTPPVLLPERDDPGIIILMYHNLVFGRTGNEYNRDIYNFEQDLKFLARQFTVIGFEDLEAIREGRMKLASDAAILSFDDGDLSMYSLAFPLLKEFGMKASFFIITEFVGKVGYMNWEQIRRISQYQGVNGEHLFTIGSHSASHPHLADVDSETVRRELRVSKSVIELQTGRRVDYIALPFGSGAGLPDIIKAARETGYKAIRTSRNTFVRPGELDLWQLPGISINNASSDKVSGQLWSLLGH